MAAGLRLVLLGRASRECKEPFLLLQNISFWLYEPLGSGMSIKVTPVTSSLGYLMKGGKPKQRETRLFRCELTPPKACSALPLGLLWPRGRHCTTPIGVMAFVPLQTGWDF